MGALSRIVTGRRSKWVVLVLALAAGLAGGSQAGKFEDAQENQAATYLPEDSGSIKALEALQGFPAGAFVPAVIVYQRQGGLTDEDLTQIEAERDALNAALPLATASIPEPEVSEDGTTALLTTGIASYNVANATEAIRERTGAPAPGLEVKVTGTAGFATDQQDVFESVDSSLLIGAAAVVLILLVVTYRSPIFWAIPFFCVLLAETASRGAGYGLTEADVTVNGQSAAILVVLVFGAGTDYALLLMARYREELRRHRDKHEAMAMALRRAAPAIIGSGLTTIAALLCLSFAELSATAGLGPVAATGIAVAMVTMLTLLPALALVGGRGAFWPAIPRYGGPAGDEVAGVWGRVGLRIDRHPRRVWIGTAALLLVMAIGLVWFDTGLAAGDAFRADVESAEGQAALEEAFPPGELAPTDVIVRDVGAAGDVRDAIEDAPGVARAGPVERGEDAARFEVVLADDPFGEAALDTVGRLRRVAREAGGRVLIGGFTAQERDLRTSVERDNRLIAPLVLLVVLVILAVLLRAIVAPLLLIATVIVSFAAALGVGAFMFEHVFGFAGSEPTLPLFAFIFLVALGIDYNIFLMTRVREETLSRGTRHGTLRGLAVTGGVITSAGIVLAATFSILAVLPLVSLTQLGFVIAFGVLLDTFIVRSVLVPALVLDAGPRSWWPSRLARFRPRDHDIDEGRDRLALAGGERRR